MTMMDKQSKKGLALVALAMLVVNAFLPLGVVSADPVPAEGQAQVIDESTVAMIGDAQYDSLQAAVDAVTPELNEIKLVKDVSADKVIEIKKSLTLDGQGYSLDSSATRGIWIEASDVTVTIKNLTVKSSSNKVERAIQVNDKANVVLNIDNCQLFASSYTINVIDRSLNTTINISNSQVQGWSALNLW